MKGRAPNFSWTGSQSVESRNRPRPMFSQAGAATRPSSRRMSPATTRRLPPKMRMPHPQARSPGLPARAGVGSAAGARLSLLAGNGDRLALDREALDGLLEHLHDRSGKWRVLEGCGGRLSLVDRPPEELHQRLALGLVLGVLVDEQVGEG